MATLVTPVCFPYMNLTRQDLLALWMNLEAIGGSSDLAGESQIYAPGNTESVHHFGLCGRGRGDHAV